MKMVASISIVISALSAIWFSSRYMKAMKNPFATITYYYDAGNCYQKISPGISGQFDCRENSLYEAYFKDVNNWTTTWTTTSSAGGGYICSITFNVENTSDGGSDGQLTLQEALNEVWNYYIWQNPDNLPSDGYTMWVSVSPLTIHRKSTVN